MSILTLALLQLAPPGFDLAANLRTGDGACRRARALGADIALFPEMWSNGYSYAAGDTVYRHPDTWDGIPGPDGAAPAWLSEPVRPGSPFLTHFRELAAELDMAIALTCLEAFDGLPRNTMTLIDRHGETVLTQAKVHTCAFALPEAGLTPGDHFGSGVLDTAAGDLRVGAMICYDREFPESARALMLAGAELILVPNACGMEHNRLAHCAAGPPRT